MRGGAGLCLLLGILTSSPSFPPVSGADVCYNLLGCFSDSPPFDNVVGFLPKSPEELEVKHQIYARPRNQNTPYELAYDDPDSVSRASSNFDPTRDLKVIIHGFGGSAELEWVLRLKNEILKYEDVNVYVVGWSKGAAQPDYFQAVANLRLVAAQVKVILSQFEGQGLSLDRVHVMGMSLGAQLAGEVGRLTTGRIGRISGLDPASPNFEGLDEAVRLDKSDAQYVDVIHTDGEKEGEDDTILDKLFDGGFGTFLPSGHVDFYVNGGQQQPGCRDGILGLLQSWFGKRRRRRGLAALTKQFSCSHGRVSDIFIESVLSTCPFTAYPCESYAKFQTGACLDCSNGGCNTMGYHSNPSAGRGRLYLNTFGERPFCGRHYGVSVTPQSSAYGTLEAAVVGDEDRSHMQGLTTSGSVWMTANSPIKGVVLSHSDTGAVTSIDAQYTRGGWFNPWTIRVNRAEVKSGVTGKVYGSCSRTTTLTNKVTKTITGFREGSC